jgi:hypothetical protein
MSAEHLQNKPIFMLHIQKLYPHHRAQLLPRDNAFRACAFRHRLDNADIIDITGLVVGCCLVSLESHAEHIFSILQIVMDLVFTDDILVFVVVVDHLFLEADFQCLLLLAHDEEE